MTAHQIRRSEAGDCLLLVALWVRSVRATHGFLAGADVAHYRPLVEEFLAGESLEVWVLTDCSNVPIGFLALSGHAIEAFLEPVYLRRGYGRRLSVDDPWVTIKGRKSESYSSLPISVH